MFAEGLDQPLVVTKRPGESGYMLQAGGTRLRILQNSTPRRRRALCSGELPLPSWTREMDVFSPICGRTIRAVADLPRQGTGRE